MASSFPEEEGPVERFSDIGAAVIGSGFIGTVHIEVLRRLGVNVRGVIDASPELAEGAAQNIGENDGHQSYDPDSRWPQCPICRQGQMRIVADIAPSVTARAPPAMPAEVNNRRVA